MGLFGHGHTLRAAALACGMAWFGPITDLRAGTLDSPPTLQVAGPSAEPFGLSVAAVYAGGLRDKWLGVARKLDDERVQLALCDGDRDNCASTAALQFLAIVDSGRARDGRARLGEINRAINLAIQPMSDLAQWGVPDRWSAPLETFGTGRGDCEDYAIAKYVALTAAGVPARDVKLVIVRNTAANEDHAIVAVRDGGDWIMLDNRWLTLVKDVAMPKTIPEFVLDDAGVREFVPPAIAVAQRMPAPASVRF